MTKQISQEDLKQILENHKKWVNGEGGERADLSDTDLRHLDLCGVDLSGANLRHADLYGADLSGANLCKANLRGADLCEADLRNADLKDAKLDYSCLPLWGGSFSAHFDDDQLKHIAYHLVRAGLQSKNASEATKKQLVKLIDFANGFHSAGAEGGCGFIGEPSEVSDNDKCEEEQQDGKIY